MSTALLPSVDEALEKAHQAIEQDQSSIAFVGPPGCGKTTALDRLAAEYPSSIRLRVPHDDDGVVAAFASLTDQLSPKALALAKDADVPFGHRLDAVLQLVEEDRAIFFDDPVLRSRAAPWEETIFSVRAREFSGRVLSLKNQLKVITLPSSAHVPALLQPLVIPVARRSEPKAILEGAGLVGPYIDQLLNSYGGTLAARSPIEIRLAGQAALNVELKTLQRSDFRLRALVELASKFVKPPVRRALGRIALVRDQSVDGCLDWACDGLTEDDCALIKRIFLFGDQGAMRLHESIVALAAEQEWLSPSKRQAAHRELADRYVKSFAQAAGTEKVTSALRHEIEAVHHRTLAGDPKLLQEGLYFAEQYDVLGKSFGQRGERLINEGKKNAGRNAIRNAVLAYERAVAHDPDDWYATHYLAFNLDVLGEQVDRIDATYQKGIQLRPTFVWGHSRWVRFLIVCGRYQDAKSAFEAALEELGAAYQPTSARFYDELHLDVARQFLQFGEYELALEVLNRVPAAVRSELIKFEPLRRYATWQKEPALNELVYPPNMPLPERAKPAFANEDESVASFMPGRFVSMTGKLARFRVKLANGFGWRDVEAKQLRRLGLGPYLPLQPGTFVEFLTVKLGGKRVERAAIHPKSNPFSELEVHYPPPDRFLDT